MGKFEFQDNLVHLDIAGHKYDIEPIAAQGKMQEIAKQCSEWQKTVGESLDGETVKTVCTEMIAMIDGLLGVGAYQTIFSGYEMSFFDIMDVLLYIMGEVNAFAASKKTEYGVQNRAQRRAAAKKK